MVSASRTMANGDGASESVSTLPPDSETRYTRPDHWGSPDPVSVPYTDASSAARRWILPEGSFTTTAASPPVLTARTTAPPWTQNTCVALTAIAVRTSGPLVAVTTTAFPSLPMRRTSGPAPFALASPREKTSVPSDTQIVSSVSTVRTTGEGAAAPGLPDRICECC